MTASAPASSGRPSLGNRAPGWIFCAATALGSVGLLWSASYPSGNLSMFVLSGWWIAGCAVAWVVRLAVYASRRRSASPNGRAWPFLIAPAAGLIVVGFLSVGTPLDARWAIGEGAFDARADQLEAKAARTDQKGGAPLLREERVALYTVSSAWVDGSGAPHFVISGSGFIDGGGFARLVDGPPAGSEAMGYEHLAGDWYTFVDEF